MQSKAERNRILSNLGAAKIIPWVLAGVVGYATYVLVALLSINYLLRKHHNHGAAIPILVIYFILFILMATSFLRLVYITMFDPPYVPLGPSAPPARRDRVNYKNKGKARHVENGIAMGEYDPGNTSEVTPEENKAQNDPDSPGLELFYTKDVFTCVMDGRPSWCSSCANWKPDRAHHCSNSGRCIIKMDHFCPWVGGPIGENNFKFFIQFNGYAALFCIHLLIVMAIYIRKQITTEDEEINHHFAAILALAAMFGLFTGSMFGTCINLAMNNLTQVERLGSRTRAYQLAVLKPSLKALQQVNPQESPLLPYNEITYPLENGRDPRSQPWAYPNLDSNSPPKSPPPVVSDAYQPHNGRTNESTKSLSADPTTELSSVPRNDVLEGLRSLAENSKHSSVDAKSHNTVQSDQPSSIGTHQDTTPDDSKRQTDGASPRDMMATRTFAVLAMETGENPWNLESRILNLETVMGTSLFDCLFPFRRSPCCNHEDPESYYYLGPAVDRIKAKYNFINAEDTRTNGGHRRPKRIVNSH